MGELAHACSHDLRTNPQLTSQRLCRARGQRSWRAPAKIFRLAEKRLTPQRPTGPQREGTCRRKRSPGFFSRRRRSLDGRRHRGRAHHHWVECLAHRPPCRQRQARADGDADLGGGHERQGRASRPPGQARLLRRPEQPGEHSQHLFEAHRRRQGRFPRRQRDQSPGGVAADRDAAQQGACGRARDRHQRRVQISALCLDQPGRARGEAGADERLLRDRRQADAEARDRGDPFVRRRIRQELSRGRARQRRRGGAQDRVRPDISAGRRHRHDADRARGPGGQSRSSRRLLLSARIGGDHPRHERDRLHAEDGRRRHGRPAAHAVEAAARPAPQRHRDLRHLAADQGHAVPRRHGDAGEVPGGSAGRGHGRPRLLLPAVRLCRGADARARDRASRQPRSPTRSRPSSIPRPSTR